MCRTEGRTLNPGTIRDQVRPQSGITYLTRFNNIQVGKIDRILIGYSLNDNLNRNLPNMGIGDNSPPRQVTQPGGIRHNRVGKLNSGDTTAPLASSNTAVGMERLLLGIGAHYSTG